MHSVRLQSWLRKEVEQLEGADFHLRSCSLRAGFHQWWSPKCFKKILYFDRLLSLTKGIFQGTMTVYLLDGIHFQ